MAKVHYCRCKINLSGQNCHIVVYDEHNPLSWPEVQVLMVLHGDENVTDVMPVKIGDIIPAREKERLWAIYGRKVEQIFPGRQFTMGLMMTEDDQLPDADAPPPPATHGPDDEEIARLAATPATLKPGRPRPEAPRV